LGRDHQPLVERHHTIDIRHLQGEKRLQHGALEMVSWSSGSETMAKA
jgi:hypothetical protein